MQKLVFCWSFSWETLQIICLCILTLMRPPGLGAGGASISSIWSVLPVLLQESYLQLVIMCVVQTEPKENIKWISFVMVCFHKVNAGKMCMYMYLDYFQTESLKTGPFFCSEMVKQNANIHLYYYEHNQNICLPFLLLLGGCWIASQRQIQIFENYHKHG